MNTDLENATKAAQSCELLCQDLRALVSTENLVLSDVAMDHLAHAQNLSDFLNRLADNLKKMREAA